MARPSAPEPRLANLLAALALALSDRQQAAARAASGLGDSACAALILVGFYPGSTIGSVARVAGVTHSVAVRLVEALEREGLATRMPGSDDKRTVALRLTAAGDDRRRAILAARAAVAKEVLDAVDPAWLAALERATEAMLDRLTVDRLSADHICRLCDEAVCPGAHCPVECAAVRGAPSP